MKPRSFLWVPWSAWLVSFGAHLALGALLFLGGRSRLQDSGAVELDTSEGFPVVSQSHPEQGEWRKPFTFKKKVWARRKPSSPVLLPAVHPAPGAGNGGFLEMDQVSQGPRLRNPLDLRYPVAARRADIEGAVIFSSGH